jgi:hypothetical protein
MAFTPFFQGTDAQNVINNYLGTGTTATTPMQLQDMNQYGVFRNPYSPEGFYANETDVNPKPPFTPPVSDENGNPQCDNANGYYYDVVTNSCKLIESQSSNNDDDDGFIDNRTEDQKTYDRMASDVTDPYGSSNEIQKYFNEAKSDASVSGDKYYDFDPRLKMNTPFLGLNLFAQGLDAFTGGQNRRTNRFNTAVQTMLNQTANDKIYGQGNNPFAFGTMVGDNTLRMYSPQNYLDKVGNLAVTGNQGSTVNDLLNSMQEAENRRNVYDSATGQTFTPQGATITTDNSGQTITGSPLRKADGTRDNTAYQSAVAKNIARNVANFGVSNFDQKLGGFTRGR